MYEAYYRRLQQVRDTHRQTTLWQGLVGLEKENLRVDPGGTIAQTPHPPRLGSALTHPNITTDYSEALLELITAPRERAQDALAELDAIMRFVYANIDDELLWATSMPCVVEGERSIPIAWFGTSNAGMMKHVYRRGLGYRYGKKMQVIAGIHFNFSFAEEWWPCYAQMIGRESQSMQTVTTDAYMGLMRNLLRFGWLIPYLFGASPAVCKSFFDAEPGDLSKFDASTFYQPYATSLRLSDIGYQNSKEAAIGIKPNYNSLAGYVASLAEAIDTPYADYQKIGVKVDGEYRQLNASRLQIENEYYSSVRVKQLAGRFEKPIDALRNRGVRYIELRSLDVSPFDPLGLSLERMSFLKAFMIFCLLHDHAPIGDDDKREIDYNLQQAALRGREPGLKLWRNGVEIELREWARELCTHIDAIAESLDSDDGVNGGGNRGVVGRQLEKIAHPEMTPSAQVLETMRADRESFFEFAMRQSRMHQHDFLQRPLSAEQITRYRELAKRSELEQAELESRDDQDFDSFLADYFGHPQPLQAHN